MICYSITITLVIILKVAILDLCPNQIIQRTKNMSIINGGVAHSLPPGVNLGVPLALPRLTTVPLRHMKPHHTRHYILYMMCIKVTHAYQPPSGENVF